MTTCETFLDHMYLCVFEKIDYAYVLEAHIKPNCDN